MMNDFLFYNPVKVYFGKDQLNHLTEEVRKFGKKVLLVYGGGSIKKNKIYKNVMKHLEEFEVFELSGVEPNPDVTSVREGAKICKEEGIDVVLAVGGGSVIDASKWIAAAACVDFDAWDFFSKRAAIENTLPLLTVLTIAATGSEMNGGGVISNRAEVKKIGRSSPLLYPKASFLNPEFTYGVSSYQTACGAADIISHVMEVYFNTQDGMYLLNAFMETLIKTVATYGKTAIEHPKDYEARANLMWAASWAINGFIDGPIRQGWNCHAIEHELSARYNIAHGHGLAIIIPSWLRYCYSEENKHIYKALATNVFESELIDNIGEVLATHFENLFFEEFGLASNLSDLDIPKEDLKDIAFSICGNGSIPGFKELKCEDVQKILENCYE